jgi:molybdate transport system substrate-binding protein
MMRLRQVLLLSALLTSRAMGQATAPAGEVTVFAAASLTEAFRELGPMLGRREKGVLVRFNFAGSQQLAVQIEQGAKADVFASADRRWMEYVQERNLVEGEPRIFVHNRLVVIVPKSNPARIRRLEDLAKRGVKLIVGAEAVPVGKYTRDAIQKLAGRTGFPPGYGDKVLANVVSQEENVKSVVAKVQLAEADAGFVYRSDVTRQVARYLDVLELPNEANVLASYPIAVIAGSSNGTAAGAFVDLVLSPEGRKVLAAHGLMPAATTP